VQVPKNYVSIRVIHIVEHKDIYEQKE